MYNEYSIVYFKPLWASWELVDNYENYQTALTDLQKKRAVNPDVQYKIVLTKDLQ